MSKHPVPRVFIIRHGETEWSLNGRHTGTTDIPLTPNGEKRIQATGRGLVGDDRLIVRRNLAAVFVSPRTRAQRTLSLLLEAGGIPKDTLHPIITTQDIREWDYGDYEGRTSHDIRAERKTQGLPEWEIWRDGCPGGESPADITTRLDRLIATIRDQYHAPALQHANTDKQGRCPPCDVLVVGHGHILRAFATRWIGRSVCHNPSMVLEAGGVGTLSYEHHNINEPAILLGGNTVELALALARAWEEEEKEGREQDVSAAAVEEKQREKENDSMAKRFHSHKRRFKI